MIHAYSAFHLDSTTLADGDYESVPTSEEGLREEARVHLTAAVEAPDQRSDDPSSNPVQEGKPRSITAISNLCNYLLLLLVH